MHGGASSNMKHHHQKQTEQQRLIALDPMNPALKHPPPIAQSGLSGFVSWLFITILLIYVLYSSRIIFDKNHDQCDLPSSEISAKENLEDALAVPVNYSSSTVVVVSSSSNLEQQNLDPAAPVKLSFRDDTELKHIVFGIAASSNLWEQRKEYIKLWWRPGETRGAVWLDKQVKVSRNERLPDIKISGNSSKFAYTNRQGSRSALRISRVVSETLRLGMKDVRWFVMGDDDTVFIVENVLRVLSKYDHNQFYYIGSSSESHVQNIFFSYAMAYGGGGFAISYPLAKELEKMQDRCIHRYPGLYGSDDRMQACMAELGVPLTKEPGFHQYDVYGNLLGLLGAHPVTPLVSLHHLDVVDPIFPEQNRVKGLQHLFESVKQDSASTIQQSICYDKKRYWSISVSWGFVVQIIRGNISPRELEMPTRTFLNWYRKADYTAYAFNTRPVTKHPCQKPFLYYMSSTRYDARRRQIIGVYSRHRESYPYCRWKMDSPEKINSIVVLKKPDINRWQKSPRRDCCRVLPSKRRTNLYIWVGNCRSGEISEL